MTAPALHGAPQTAIRAAGRDTTAAASGELCLRAAEAGVRVSARTARKALARPVHPDVAAYAASLDIGDVAHIAWLQQRYDSGMLLVAEREEETPVLVRTMHRRGSVPVDAAVGERVARR